MMMGWNIFPWFAGATAVLAVVASAAALCNRRTLAIVTSSFAVAVLGAFVARARATTYAHNGRNTTLVLALPTRGGRSNLRKVAL